MRNIVALLPEINYQLPQDRAGALNRYQQDQESTKSGSPAKNDTPLY